MEVSIQTIMLLYFTLELTREEAPHVDSWLIGTAELVGECLERAAENH